MSEEEVEEVNADDEPPMEEVEDMNKDQPGPSDEDEVSTNGYIIQRVSTHATLGGWSQCPSTRGCPRRKTSKEGFDS